MLQSTSVVSWMALRHVHRSECVKRDRQFTYDVLQRRFRVTIVTVDKYYMF
jgi:hypothetical protein